MFRQIVLGVGCAVIVGVGVLLVDWIVRRMALADTAEANRLIAIGGARRVKHMETTDPAKLAQSGERVRRAFYAAERRLRRKEAPPRPTLVSRRTGTND